MDITCTYNPNLFQDTFYNWFAVVWSSSYGVSAASLTLPGSVGVLTFDIFDSIVATTIEITTTIEIIISIVVENEFQT